MISPPHLVIKISLGENRPFVKACGYDKAGDHALALVARKGPLPPIPDIGLTEFAQALPDKHRVPGDAVRAYRAYCVGEKARIARWTRRQKAALVCREGLSTRMRTSFSLTLEAF